ncbi:MAG: alpha-2-macroglobulin [Pseudomonadota bacterium]
MQSVFGTFRWTAPEWVKRLGTKRLVVGSLLVAAIIFGIITGQRYLASLPQPPHVVVQVAAPGLTPVVNGDLAPQPLNLNFSVKTDPRYPADSIESIASLDQLDDTVSEGITLTPEIAGKWRWSNERQLRFVPAEDWPAGVEYSIRYDKTLFAPGLEFRENEATFQTPLFGANVTSIEFYQDPIEQDLRKVVATLDFTHPVDIASLQDHVTFTMRESGATITGDTVAFDADITVNENGRQAYIHSAPIEIPANENFMTLRVERGTAPRTGTSKLTEALSEKVRIPDVSSYFTVSEVSTITARDEKEDFIQTLTIRFTDRVDIQRVQDNISVYLLPKDAQINNRRRSNYRWQSPREVTPANLENADAVDITLSAVEGDAATIHSAPLDLPVGRYVYVKINEGLGSNGGFVLSRDYDAIARVPDYPMEATIAQSGAVLPLSSAPQLSLVSRGVPTLRVEVNRILADDINHLVSQTGGDIKNPYFNNYRFSEDNMTTRAERFIDVSQAHPAKANYSSIDLGEFLPEGGMYLVRVQGWDRKDQRPLGRADRRFVLISDIGLLVKTNADSSHDVFVHSIETGEPLSGAQIDLLGKNGIPIITRTVSSDGHVTMPPTNGFDREKTPTVFVVRQGRDIMFMPYNRQGRMLQYSRFDVGGRYTSSRNAASKLRAQLFTDRGIYRPGDTINIASIVKREDWRPLGKLPLAMQVVDPRGQVVMKERIALPDIGLFDRHFQTESTTPTGNYNVTLYLIDNNRSQRVIGNTRFKVEEFLPDRLRIRSEIRDQRPKGWLKSDTLTTDVSLETLFGTAAQDRRVTGKLTLRPANLYFADYKNFVFSDPLRRPDSPLQPVDQSLQETRTDTEGRAEFAIDLSRYETGIYELTVRTEGFEQGGGRSVSAEARVMVSPLDYVIGHKTEGNLSFINKDAVNRIEYIAVDHAGKAIEATNLNISLLEYRYVSSLVQRPDGTYAYQSIRQESQLSKADYTVNVDGTTYTVPTDKPGMYAVVLSNDAGLVFSKVDYTVAGARNQAGNLERNAELALNIDATSYAPGDEIQLEITAPYEGTGIVTIERDRVYAYQWIESDTRTSVHTIRVPENLEGNAYLNVAFVRRPDSPEIYVNPLSYAVAPFSVNRDARTLDITLDSPALVRPGDALTIRHQTSQPSRLVVYAVDEGILQVAKYQMPNPLDFFLPKMALQVATHQMVDLILPEFAVFNRIAAPGGGEAASRLGSNLNPFQRATDAPAVFWSGVIDSGPDGGTLTYRIPDHFNGELRVMAVAIADDAVGRKQTKTTVRAPFVVSPNVLTAAAPGDEFEVNVGVANNLEGSGDGANIQLSATFSQHLMAIGPSEQSLVIDEGSETSARFRFRVLKKLGPAELNFTASLAGESTRARATLSVRPPVAYVATSKAGSSDSETLTLAFDRSLFPEFAKQRVAASASPLVLADGMLEYLDAFPHACAEQIVSKVFPQIGFIGTGDDTVDERRVRSLFDSTVNKLRSRQSSNGGFLFWATSDEPADFASVYIMHFLTDAAELGLPVPRDMQTAGLDYLRQIAGRNANTLPSGRLRAYAIYVLTRNGVVTTNYLTDLHESLDASTDNIWKTDLIASYMAASYAMLRQSQLSDRLIDDYAYGSGDEMTHDFDTRLGRDAQHLYLLSRHFPAAMKTIDSTTIRRLIDPVLQDRFNTLSSAYTILALGAYSRAVLQDEASTVSIATLVDDNPETVAGPAYFARADVQQDIEKVRVTSGKDQTFFYTLMQSGFDETTPQKPIAEGIELQREYLNAEGRPVTTATIGDELTIRLRIRSTGQPRSNIAVVDLLPGGFEVSRDSLQRSYDRWASDYIDVREDRVVIYGTFANRVTEIRYRVKLVSAGTFVTPSAFASSMYNRDIAARTAPGQFEVQSVE